MQAQRSPQPSPAEKPPPKKVNLGGGGFARRLVVALLLVPLKEVYDLPTEGEPWQNLPRPPRFQWSSERNLDAPSAAFEIDGRHANWSPSLTTKPAGFEDVSYERLLDAWAKTQSAQELERLKDKCVFDWGPGFKLPNWWRINFHEDDTYRTLLTAWVDNYRPWQPGLAVSPSSFIKYRLPAKYDDGAAAASSDQPPTFSREALAQRRAQQVESAASTWERQIEQRLIGRTDSEQPSEGGGLSRQASAAGSASALRDPEAEEEEVGID